MKTRKSSCICRAWLVGFSREGVAPARPGARSASDPPIERPELVLGRASEAPSSECETRPVDDNPSSGSDGALRAGPGRGGGDSEP
eukprot:3754825-Pyramimonas_sp.AAC.1